MTRPLKQTLGILIILLYANISAAQNLSYNWAKKLGGSANDLGKDITTDDAGNVYTTGFFASPNADFDPSNNTTNISTNGSFDIYVSKLDANGSYVWAKGIGGSSIDQGNSVAVDAAGNVYVTGLFYGTADFDPGNSVHNLTSNGDQDIFILKLDPNGDFLWARNFGSSSSDEGLKIKVDASGNVITTGYFIGTVDFDPGKGTQNLTSTGSSDIFVLKLTPSGTFMWAKNVGGNSNDNGRDLSIDNGNNIILTGAFRNTVDFDPGTGIFNLSTVNGAQDAFILKLNSLGNFVWAKAFGGTGDDIGHAITLDPSGNIYTTGEFSETANFDPGPSTTNITAYGSADAFVSKLDANGNFLWAKKLGGTDLDRAYGIASDASGSTYITGEFRGTVDMDPGAGTSSFSSAGISDIFMVKLNPNGNHLWSERYGRNLDDKGYAMHIDATGNLYATGHFMVTVFFDPPSSGQVSSSGGMDAYIAKFSCTPTTGTHTVTACKSYIFNEIEYTSDNNTAKDTIANSFGCDSIITLDLTINNLDVSTNTTGNTISANLSGASYQWINCGKGVLIPGETGQSLNIVADGEYAVIVSFKGCTDTSECVSMFVNRIKNSKNPLNLIEVYPNPTKGQFYIELPNSQKNLTIALYSLDGRLLKQIGTYPNVAKLEMDLGMKSGVYVLKLQNETGFEKTIKLVKQ